MSTFSVKVLIDKNEFFLQNFAKSCCDVTSNNTYPTNIVQIIELSQCPPEILVLSKNKSCGGDRFELVLKRKIKSMTKVFFVQFKVIDLQNGAYLFFIPSNGENFSIGKEYSVRLRSWTQRSEDEETMSYEPLSLNASYVLQLYFLSNNCDFQPFGTYSMNKHMTRKKVVENLNNVPCIPHTFNYGKLLTKGERKVGNNFESRNFATSSSTDVMVTNSSSKYLTTYLKMSKQGRSMSIPNIHFLGDSTSKSLFKFKPYFVHRVGMMRNTTHPLHTATYYHFHHLFLDLLLKYKQAETQILFFSNWINDISSNLHSDYFLTLGTTFDRLLSSLSSSKELTSYKSKILILSAPYLSYENDLNCKQKSDLDIQTECVKLANTYSHEKVTLLNNIYQVVASRHKHVYIINISSISNEGSWEEMYSTDLSGSLLNSKILNSIWKSILRTVLHL